MLQMGSLISSGGWEGQAHFKMTFLHGGAIELGQHLFKLASNGEFVRNPRFVSTATVGGTLTSFCDPVAASRAAPAQNGASSYGYPSPSAMNGYGPPPPAPPGYAYQPPAQANGFYPGPAPPPGNMGYPYPAAAAGKEWTYTTVFSRL